MLFTPDDYRSLTFVLYAQPTKTMINHAQGLRLATSWILPRLCPTLQARHIPSNCRCTPCVSWPMSNAHIHLDLHDTVCQSTFSKESQALHQIHLGLISRPAAPRWSYGPSDLGHDPKVVYGQDITRQDVVARNAQSYQHLSLYNLHSKARFNEC